MNEKTPNEIAEAPLMSYAAPLWCDLEDASILWTLVDRGVLFTGGQGGQEKQTALRDRIGKLIRTLRDGQPVNEAPPKSEEEIHEICDRTWRDLDEQKG